MPSPFPGMNPYLEQTRIWQDFHGRLIPAISDALAPQVSPHFVVRIEEYLFIQEPSAEERLRTGRADVALSGSIHVKRGSPVASGALLEAPTRLTLTSEFEVENHSYLEILDRNDHDVVAVIEVLSPSNKRPGGDRELYLNERRGILRSRTHLVEIDLLRGGPRLPAEGLVPCDYSVLVSRFEERPNVGYWPIAMRERLPKIPIPLREPIVEASIDLQELLHSVYDRAYYVNDLYDGTPEPPLVDDDLEWANGILKSAGIINS